MMKKLLKNKVALFFIVVCIFLFLCLLFLLKRDGYFDILKHTMKNEKHSYLDNAQYTQRETMFESSKVEGVDVVFVGDSITARIEWEEFIDETTVLNRGIDSDVTEGVENRLDEVIRHNPKTVVLMIGINDIRQSVPKEETLSHYETILKTLQEKLPETKVIVQSVLPVRQSTGINNQTVSELNAGIKELANAYHMDYVDIFSNMVDENNDLPAEYSIDGVHMTGDGYKIWLDALSEYLKIK